VARTGKIKFDCIFLIFKRILCFSSTRVSQ